MERMKQAFPALIVLFLATLCALPLCAADKPKTVVTVDLVQYNPSLDQVVSEKNPLPVTALNTVIKNYEKLYPAIKIEVVRYQGDQSQWMTTRLAAGDGPDIAIPGQHPSQFTDRGWALDIDVYMKKPNPFEPGNKVWWDMYYPSLKFQCSSKDGHLDAAPLHTEAGSQICFFYNADLLKKLNIDLPKTWGELIDAGKKVQKAGYYAAIPWAGQKDPSLWPLGAELSIPLYDKFSAQWNYTKATKAGDLASDYDIRAINKGIISASMPETRLAFQFYKEWSKLWAPGWNSTDLLPLWREGKVAFREAGMWELGAEISDTNRKFKFGLLPFPYLSSDSTPLAKAFPMSKNVPAPINVHPPMVIAPSVQGHKNLDAAITFLQYLTATKNEELIVNEHPGAIPASVKAKWNPVMETLKSVSWTQIPEIYMKVPANVSGECQDIFTRLTGQWFRDEIKDDVFFQKIQETWDTEVKKIIETQNIDTSKW